MSSYVKFPDKPGVFRDDTPLTASVFYVDADGVRWNRGKWEPRKGCEKASTDTFSGICRGLFAWRNEHAQPLGAIGTHTHVYELFDGDLYDITPVVEFGVLTNPFTTTNASAIVTVHDIAHGRAEGDEVRFFNATAVGGITIDGRYEVTEVVGADDYTITHSAAATSGATGGGTVDYDFFLPIGLVDGTGGQGFGVGAIGLGPYGQGADINEFYPRTHSMDNWGSNLLCNPRGLGIYERSPVYATPELVTNGNFAVDANWTKGTGWSISGGAALATAGMSGLLSQQLSLTPGAYFRVEFDLTRIAGTLTPQMDGTAIGAAIDASGRYRRTFFSSTGLLAFSKDASFGGTLDNVSVTQLFEMTPVPNAPIENTCMIVTAEDMVMVGGTIDEQTGEFDPLLLRWCARRNNQLWTPGFEAGNTSGKYRLARGTRIVKIVNGRGEVLIYTDEGLYVGRSNPDPTINYSFTYMGKGGLIGPNAVTVVGAAYWIGPAGQTLRYAGTAPENVPCTLQKDFTKHLSRSQQDKIYASGLAATNEVQFIYPDSRDGNECSRYIKYNWADDCWDPGASTQSAWIDTSSFGYQLSAGLNGLVYYQEFGNSNDGGPLTGFIESGAFSLRDGKIASILAVVPDFAGLIGGVQLTIKTYLYPSGPEQILGPYDVTSATRKVDVRAPGRQIAFRYEWNAAPMEGRSGTMQFDVRDTRCSR